MKVSTVRRGGLLLLPLLAAALDATPVVTQQSSPALADGIVVPAGWRVASPTTLDSQRPKPEVGAAAGKRWVPSGGVAVASAAPVAKPKIVPTMVAQAHMPAVVPAATKLSRMVTTVAGLSANKVPVVPPSASKPKVVPTMVAQAHMPAVVPAVARLTRMSDLKAAKIPVSHSVLRRQRRVQQATKNATANATEAPAEGNATDGAVAAAPTDNYVPAYEGVLMPPSGDVAPPEDVAPAVPQEHLEKIVSVECLSKTLEDPNYVCEDTQYVSTAPAAAPANGTNATAALAAPGSPAAAAPAQPAAPAAADIPPPAPSGEAQTVGEAVAQAKAAADTAKKAAAAAQAAYERAAELSGQPAAPAEAASLYAVKHEKPDAEPVKQEKPAAKPEEEKRAPEEKPLTPQRRTHKEVSVSKLHLVGQKLEVFHPKLRRSARIA